MPEATETAKNGIFSSALIACTTWVSHFGWHGEMNKVYSDTQISNNVHLNLGQISHLSKPDQVRPTSCVM